MSCSSFVLNKKKQQLKYVRKIVVEHLLFVISFHSDFIYSVPERSATIYKHRVFLADFWPKLNILWIAIFFMFILTESSYRLTD